MKKLRTKRGFTLVEVMVAFVIFSIMAAMVAGLLMTINRTKQENLKIESEIEQQKNAYYLTEQDTSYAASNKAGTLNFHFSGVSDFGIDYEIGNPNDASYTGFLEINYPVGNVDYSKLEENNPEEVDPKKGGKGVTDRLDSRIYGDEDIDTISVKLVYDAGYTGTGYRYKVYSTCNSAKYKADTTSDYRNYSQYRLVFPSPILEYGYFKEDADGKVLEVRKLEEKVSPTYKATITDDFDVYCPVRNTPILWDVDDDGNRVSPLLYGGIIRIASLQTGTTLFELDDAGGRYFYVVLQDKLEYDPTDPSVPEYKKWNISDITTIFGTTGTNCDLSDLGVDSDGRYIYTHYEEVKDGSTEFHKNLFGCFPNKDYVK